MYAVIFRAKVAHGDDGYFLAAKRLRELALEKYGCLEFVSMMEGDEEIAVSYWKNETHIMNWKKDPEHIKAQEEGRTRWYEAYRVDVCKVERAYTSSG